MSEPENVLYNVDVIWDLNLLFDDENSSVVPVANFEGDLKLGKSSKTGNITVYKDSKATTFSQEKLIYISNVTTDIQTQINSANTLIFNNSSNISTNTANIRNLTSTVSNNTSNITTNTKNLSNLSSTVSNNTSNITTNTKNLSNLTSIVSDNTSNITTNTNNLSNLTSTVSDNTSNITLLNSLVNISVITVTDDVAINFPLTNNFYVVDINKTKTITLPKISGTSDIGKKIYFKNICSKTAIITPYLSCTNNESDNKSNKSNESDSSSDNIYANDSSETSSSYRLRKGKFATIIVISKSSWCVHQ